MKQYQKGIFVLDFLYSDLDTGLRSNGNAWTPPLLSTWLSYTVLHLGQQISILLPIAARHNFCPQ